MAAGALLGMSAAGWVGRRKGRVCLSVCERVSVPGLAQRSACEGGVVPGAVRAGRECESGKQIGVEMCGRNQGLGQFPFSCPMFALMATGH